MFPHYIDEKCKWGSITLSKCICYYDIGDRVGQGLLYTDIQYYSPMYCVELQCSIDALPPYSLAINY